MSGSEVDGIEAIGLESVDEGVEVRSGMAPLAVAGVGVAAFAAGAALMAVWSPKSEPASAEPVSVYSCAEQYALIVEGLNTMVAEGINAGQAPTPDVSWINSINDRQEAFAEQLSALNAECIDVEGKNLLHQEVPVGGGWNPLPSERGGSQALSGTARPFVNVIRACVTIMP
jgi:hypothetical protein